VNVEDITDKITKAIKFSINLIKLYIESQPNPSILSKILDPIKFYNSYFQYEES